MNRIIEQFDKLAPVQGLYNKITSADGKQQIYVSTLTGCIKSLFVNKLTEDENQIVILFDDIKAIEEFNVELDSLGLSEKIILIDEFDGDTLQQKLTLITNRTEFIILSTYTLLNCTVPDKKKLENNTSVIDINNPLIYNELVEYLNEIRYQKEKYVEAQGEYSVRGSIIDFWSFSEKNPVRLEYDGDILDSIRYFDPENQRSFEKVNQITVAAKLSEETKNDETFTGFFSYLNEPLVFAGYNELNEKEDEIVNNFNPELSTARPDEIEYDLEENFPEAGDNETVEVQSKKKIFDKLNEYNARWIIEQNLRINEEAVQLEFNTTPVINANFKILESILLDYLKKDYTIYIASENDLQSSKIRELLTDMNDEFADAIDESIIKIDTLTIKAGFVHNGSHIILLTAYEIFNRPFRTKIIKKKKKKAQNKGLGAIKKGDYVVHENYGIAKYIGLETIKIGDIDQESMKLMYNEGGIVYVNLNYLHLVKKYSSDEALTPPLSTLGTNTWNNTKQKAKKKIKEAAKDLIELYARRKASIGYNFNHDTIWQKELEASFFYEDTPDQLKVTNEVKEDMEERHPMDRLVCGDVGYGKTEIAVRAAFKAVQDGKQVAVLVPTTILAEQHYNTFTDRLNQFPVKIGVLSRFHTKGEHKEVIEGLAQGQMDIVIGTHRLISKDVKFRDLGLLIIDEEHRFGVSAKEKLKSLKVNVDTLTLTATPIPRTLNLSLLGARDLSIISTPPPNRQPIYTKVAVFDILKIKEWIYNELNRNGQVYVVHDRVQSIERLAAYLQKYMPKVRIGIAHGQMKTTELENVIHKFLNKEFDILLATKIIESGIDIPNVNTMIINRADRFGLAELHQLRGRVGRANRQAYAYLIVPSLTGINKKALKRLEAIEEFSGIGSGFNIAMRDLEIRGAGNLLGTEQSGFINDVGFDLYIKMINEAVEELKYEEFKDIFKDLPKPKDRTETVIDSYFEIGIPENYMQDQMDRLNYYTALYASHTVEDVEEIKDEIKDRFGELPVITRRLILSAILKLHASYALFGRIIIHRKSITIILPKPENEEFYKFRFLELIKYLNDNYRDKIKFDQQQDVMKLILSNFFDKPEAILEYLIRFSKEVTRLYKNEVPNKYKTLEEE